MSKADFDRDLASIFGPDGEQPAVSLPDIVTVLPKTLDDIWRDCETVGAACGDRAAGVALGAKLRADLDALRTAVAPPPGGSAPPKVAVLEWCCAGCWKMLTSLVLLVQGFARVCHAVKTNTSLRL